MKVIFLHNKNHGKRSKKLKYKTSLLILNINSNSLDFVFNIQKHIIINIYAYTIWLTSVVIFTLLNITSCNMLFIG